MTETTKYPNLYKLNHFLVYPYVINEEDVEGINITNLVTDFEIIESIENDSIRGRATVLDTIGFIEKFPLRGEERLYIEVKDSMENTMIYNMFLYKVDNVSISNNNDSLSYTIHFVSFQRFVSDTRKIVSSFKDKTSEIIKNIFNKHYKTNDNTLRIKLDNDFITMDENGQKDIFIEETSGVVTCVIPKYTPLQAIKFLTSRSYSNDSPSCSFRFFENTLGFHFITDESLYENAILNNKIFTFHYYDALPKYGKYHLNQLTNLETIKNTKRFDTFDDIHGGTYKNKVLVLDILNKTTNIKEKPYDYNTKKYSFFNTGEGQDVVDRHTDSFIEKVFNDENCRQFLIVKDYADEEGGQLKGEQYISEIASNKLSYRKHLQSIKVNASGPGRLDITCGDIVNLEIEEFTFANNKIKEKNKQLSGTYIVENVTRTFDANVYKNNYVLMKRNWSDVTDSKVNSSLLNLSKGLKTGF